MLTGDFKGLAPMRDDYAVVPIRYGFNWDEVFGGSGDFRVYLVVFRSLRRAGADIGRLFEYDDFAHAEARRSEGFMHYFKGGVERDRFCLSFCLWKNRACAESAARGDFHRRAVGIVDEMYESYDLERYEVYREAGGALFFRTLSPVRTGD
ncbi:hypothetical protein [Rubrobacter indicoceani]|uniref:hypothetical protein n=1 Tax=Rubrobacter indicoceani TaxID=2051957 RepID=UPI000E5BBB26|nr:hypothetical protein [Rubrobacter indicoceani]